VWDKNRVITVAIIVGLFGGLIGGPIASLVYYDSAPEERFHVFIIPEIVGFICAGLMIYVGKLNGNGNGDDTNIVIKIRNEINNINVIKSIVRNQVYP
jgi:hypothetical protein